MEEFIEGEEFGAQAFVENGEVLFVEPHGDDVMRKGQINVPIGHYMPFVNHDSPRYNMIESIVTKAIKALNFDNCAVNIDLIMKDKQPYVIELTGRAGANFLPELTGTYLGLNYYEMVLRKAMGESVKDYYKNRANNENTVLTKMLYSEQTGLIKKITVGEDEHVKKCILYVSEGNRVNRFTNSRDCIGKILVVGNSISECNHTANDFIYNKLIIDLV